MGCRQQYRNGPQRMITTHSITAWNFGDVWCLCMDGRTGGRTDGCSRRCFSSFTMTAMSEWNQLNCNRSSIMPSHSININMRRWKKNQISVHVFVFPDPTVCAIFVRSFFDDVVVAIVVIIFFCRSGRFFCFFFLSFRFAALLNWKHFKIFITSQIFFRPIVRRLFRYISLVCLLCFFRKARIK